MKPIQELRGSTLPVFVILLILLVVQIGWFFVNLTTWMDESLYLYKSSAMFGHGLKLYSEELPGWYTPLYFVVLGGWQELFGYGLASGRALSIFLYLGGIGILFSVAKTFNSSRLTPWVIPALIVITPSITALHVSATQFAFVNLQMALLIWVLFVWKNAGFRWWVAGALMGTIAMTRPNMILVAPLLPLLFVWLKGWTGWKPVLQFVVSWIVVDAIIVSIFGYGALWNMIRAFPGADFVSNISGLSGKPGVGATSHGDIGLKAPSWAAQSPENMGGSHIYFFKGFLWPYLVIVAINVAGLIKWKADRFAPSLAVGFSIVFMWSALIHFYATQTYCKNCAHAYMNYSIFLGLLGAGGHSSFIVNWLRDGLLNRNPRVVTTALAVVCWVALAWLPGGSYRKWSAPSMSTVVREVASRLDECLPEQAHVLALGTGPLLVQAIHKSGRTVSPMTINYMFSIQELVDPVAKFSPDVQSKIKARGLWTMQLMKEWLENDFQYVLYRKSAVIHKATLKEYFNSRELYAGVYLATRISLSESSQSSISNTR
ncbi:MAG: hypothetical protein P1V20_11790 [Verrucomicrobiales bacterium]|nr:hypothetical protein [Verrucomicrobiales bacterium]